MRLVTTFAALAACSGEPQSLADPPRAATSDDRGVFVAADGSWRETFEVQRAGDHQVTHVHWVSRDKPDDHVVDGELERDARGQLVRVAMRRLTPSDGITISLGGSPLVYDRVRDDKRRPVHVKPARFDLLVNESAAALQWICTLRADAALRVPIDEPDDPVVAAHVAKPVPLGALARYALDVDGLIQFELLCDRDRLVAGGYGSTLFVREGRERDLEALRGAPALSPRRWPDEIEPTRPWTLDDAWQVDRDLAVTADQRRHTVRLTSVDLRTGARIASRDLAGEDHLRCAALGKARLACMIGETARLIDARTLADGTDLTAIVRAAFPDIAKDALAHAAIGAIDADHVALRILEDRVHIDLRDGSAAKVSSKRLVEYMSSPCQERTTATKVGGTTWSIEYDMGHGKLMRPGAPPRDLDTGDAFFHCASRPDAAYLTRATGKTTFALELLGADTRPRWSTELEGSMYKAFWLAGDQVIIAPGSQRQHVVALDAATGKIRWTAAGP